MSHLAQNGGRGSGRKRKRSEGIASGLSAGSGGAPRLPTTSENVVEVVHMSPAPSVTATVQGVERTAMHATLAAPGSGAGGNNNSSTTTGGGGGSSSSSSSSTTRRGVGVVVEDEAAAVAAAVHSVGESHNSDLLHLLREVPPPNDRNEEARQVVQKLYGSEQRGRGKDARSKVVFRKGPFSEFECLVLDFAVRWCKQQNGWGNDKLFTFLGIGGRMTRGQREFTKDYSDIACCFPDRKLESVKFLLRKRYHSGRNRGAFTKEEDKMIKHLYAKHGARWNLISRQMGHRRAPNVIAYRWRALTRERSMRVGKYSPEEDQMIVSAVRRTMKLSESDPLPQRGLPFTEISQHVPTRTYRQLIERWPNLLKKLQREGVPVVESLERHVDKDARGVGVVGVGAGVNLGDGASGAPSRVPPTTTTTTTTTAHVHATHPAAHPHAHAHAHMHHHAHHHHAAVPVSAPGPPQNVQVVHVQPTTGLVLAHMDPPNVNWRENEVDTGVFVSHSMPPAPAQSTVVQAQPARLAAPTTATTTTTTATAVVASKPRGVSVDVEGWKPSWNRKLVEALMKQNVASASDVDWDSVQKTKSKWNATQCRAAFNQLKHHVPSARTMAFSDLLRTMLSL